MTLSVDTDNTTDRDNTCLPEIGLNDPQKAHFSSPEIETGLPGTNFFASRKW